MERERHLWGTESCLLAPFLLDFLLPICVAFAVRLYDWERRGRWAPGAEVCGSTVMGSPQPSYPTAVRDNTGPQIFHWACLHPRMFEDISKKMVTSVWLTVIHSFHGVNCWSRTSTSTSNAAEKGFPIRNMICCIGIFPPSLCCTKETDISHELNNAQKNYKRCSLGHLICLSPSLKKHRCRKLQAQPQ